MRTVKSIIQFVLFLLIVMVLSCGATQEIVIDIQLQDGYPQISFENKDGNPIQIAPVSPETGSLGYEINNEIFWLQGLPEKDYIWQDNEGREIKLCIENNEDPVFKMHMANSDVPVTRWFVNIAAQQDEYFTGIFERVVDGGQTNSWAEGITTAMDLNGEIVEMQLKPTVSAYAPFYISSENYAFMAYGTWPGKFDFCKTEAQSVQIEFQGPELTFKLYRAESPAELVTKHALETGPSVVPPKWAFGPWRWRDNHYHREAYYDGTPVKAPFNSEVVEDVLMMEAYDIPCTAYWIDRPWGPGPRGFDDYEFDPERFPNAEDMIPWLNAKNMELMMWIGPFVMGDMANVAEERGYDLKSNVWKKSRQVLMDFTNDEAVEWWGENGPGKLAKMGIKGFKMDRADGEKLTDSLHLKTHIGTTYRENFNDYPRQYVKAAYEAVKPVLGDDFILFPRAQYTGSAKYGGLWSGDPRGVPEGLRSVVIAMQRCSVMGYPIWGSDIGGYGRQFNRETCMRWLGFGCFSPIMENGPNADRGFWNSVDTPSYDVELIAAWRLYAKTRMKLIDYIHDLTKVAKETGMPIARPLFLHYPEQEKAWQDWQTYLFGPDILVSIIWKSGKDTHSLYLPAGETWVDAWDKGKVYQGGTTIEVDAPMYKTPIFIRQGSDIDLGDLEGLYQESLKIAEKKPDLVKLEKNEGWR